MDANEQDDKTFGLLVGRDRSQIYRIRNGTSRPSDELKAIIADKTAGEVPVDVWFNGAPKAQAA